MLFKNFVAMCLVLKLVVVYFIMFLMLSTVHIVMGVAVLFYVSAQKDFVCVYIFVFVCVG